VEQLQYSIAGRLKPSARIIVFLDEVLTSGDLLAGDSGALESEPLRTSLRPSFVSCVQLAEPFTS
jgi:hypothetical protein